MRERRSLLINFIFLLAGVAIGGAAVGIWVQHAKPDWVEAYGTWFGAIGTVAAVLWAVQTFMADQVHRQEQMDAAATKDVEIRAAEAAAMIETASRVKVSLRGGRGLRSG